MNRPLFYRLSDPHRGRDLETVEHISKTVVEEVERILSTKYIEESRGSERNILNFGIPNVVQLSMNNSVDEMDLQRGIKEAIDEFEPRLRNVEVELSKKERWDKYIVSIHADLIMDGEVERFTFPISITV